MKKGSTKRLLSVLLVLAMLMAYALPAMAGAVTLSDKAEGLHSLLTKKDPVSSQNTESLHEADEIVRVSIVLADKSTVEKGFSTKNIAENAAAMKYRAGLQAKQDSLAQKISSTLGEKLDVVWNLTLAANIISANVKFGQIKAIRAIPGVKSVILETKYYPQEVKTSDKPNMAISTGMTGASAAWNAGFTGAGSRIAIIDTGLDTAHQSFDNGAFLLALEKEAEKVGMTRDAYMAKKGLLTESKIGDVLTKLNAYKRIEELRKEGKTEQALPTATDLFLTDKLPYAFNYVDIGYDVTHLHDTQGEHGSHVAGIAAANRYIPDLETETEGDYLEAMNDVNVVGNAPDAQVLVMKVFGQGGGANDSDWMAAIEDAIFLNCDAVNLSLGSGYAGFTESMTPEYQKILNDLEKTNTVVVISAGNNSAFGQYTHLDNYGRVEEFLYSDDVNFHTGGSPGTYANALTVASVDNQGVVDYYFTVNGKKYVYFDNNVLTGYTFPNPPISTLGGQTLDYVFIEGIGKAEDYTGIDVTGKVVFVPAIGGNYYSEKVDVAAGLGAKAVAVYNNDDSILVMNTLACQSEIPAISLGKTDADAIKNDSTPQTTDAGVTYYTGSITIPSGAPVGVVPRPSDYYTISDFSSWGVPGNLTLKPEITAPGGNVYSVNGTAKTPNGTYTGGTTQYEQMSGTSMAAPQVTGMMAVLMQYIKEKELHGADMTNRALAQSLLMSTAKPMSGKDAAGKTWIYPVLQQGAGLANVTSAMGAASYVTVDGQSDGKVKVELGDDPEKNGIYTFSYNLTNLTNQPQTYSMDADVFTQAWIKNADKFDCMGRTTMPMDANVTYSVNGSPVVTPDAVDPYDFDGDGDVDKADAQLLMDHLIQGKALIANQDHTDVDKDGDTDTHDVYTLLALLDASKYVEVPASASVKVTVTIDITRDAGTLNTLFPNGFYVEAFVYANAVANGEEVITSSHSIPVLGFYGNWSDASVFDKGTATKPDDRIPYFSDYNEGPSNSVLISMVDGEYYFGGNPYADETYVEDRNALNNLNSFLSTLNYALIRNAGAGRITITNAATGDVYYEAPVGEGDDWGLRVAGFLRSTNDNPCNQVNTQQSIPLNWKGTDKSGNPLPEGTTVELKLTMAPEYYVNGDNVAWDKLGKGASLSIKLTIDNTAPTVVGGEEKDGIVKLTGNVNTLTVHDNRHIAIVGLYTAAGEAIAEVNPEQTAPDQNYTLDLESPLADGVYILDVADYAGNESIYRLFVNVDETDKPEDVQSVTVLPETAEVFPGGTAQLSANVLPYNLTDRTVTWSSSDETIATVDENGVVTGIAPGECTITATSNQNPEIKGSCTFTVASLPYVLSGALQDVDGSPMTFTWDLNSGEGWKKVADIKPSVGSIALSSDGLYYLQDAEMNTYLVDPATGEYAMGPAVQVPFWDMTASVFDSADQSLVTGICESWLLPLQNPFAPNFSGLNFAPYFSQISGAKYFVGVATARGYTDDTYGMTEEIWALDDAGVMWVIDYAPFYNENKGHASISYVPTSLTELPVLAYQVYGEYSQCSLVQAEYGTLFFSYFNGETNVIYKLDLALNGEDLIFEATELADVGKDVWPAQLAGASPNAATVSTLSVMDAPAEESLISRIETMGKATRLDAELCKVERIPALAEKAEVFAGKLNEANGSNPTPRQEPTDSEVLAVPITAKDKTGMVSSNNGKITVSYDPEELELIGCVGLGEVNSFQEASGKIDLGYADLDAFAAGEAVATLYFKVKTEQTTEVTSTSSEIDNRTLAEDDQSSDVQEHTHTCTTEVVAPTCTEQGYTVYTCTECGYSYKADYTDPAHSYGEWEQTKAPTCTEKGERKHTCTKCGHAETEEIASLGGHKYVDVVTKPTSTEKGYTTHTCSECGDSYIDSYKDPVEPGNSQTGDSFSALLLTLPVLSAMGMVTLVIGRKKWLAK